MRISRPRVHYQCKEIAAIAHEDVHIRKGVSLGEKARRTFLPSDTSGPSASGDVARTGSEADVGGLGFTEVDDAVAHLRATFLKKRLGSSI